MQIRIFYKNQSYMKINKQRAIKQSAQIQSNKNINILYEQFQSLKSQIYGNKNKISPIQQTWTNSSHKVKASQNSRQSTIRKFHQQFQQNLQTIQQNANKISLKKQQPEYRQQSQIEQIPYDIKLFSKRLSKENNSFDQTHQKYQNNETKIFYQSQEKFKHLINSAQRKNYGPVQNPLNSFIKNFQLSLNEVSINQFGKLSRILETINFMTQKLHCLELIFQQYIKILHFKLNTGKRKDSAVLVNINAIQQTYEKEIEDLKLYYQKRIREIEKSKEHQVKIDIKNYLERYDEENKRLKDTLEKAKQLISTKDQLIASLQQENIEFKQQIQKYRSKSIRQSGASSLAYSGTADKKIKVIKDELAIHSKQKDPNQSEKKSWDEFCENSSDQINYSQLESVKDKSLDDWDISHLKIEQSSNVKSLGIKGQETKERNEGI